MTISPEENYIIVGCLDGTLRVYSQTLKQLRIIRDSLEEISDLKISPNGKILAVGSHDNMIYVYELPSFK